MFYQSVLLSCVQMEYDSLTRLPNSSELGNACVGGGWSTEISLRRASARRRPVICGQDSGADAQALSGLGLRGFGKARLTHRTGPINVVCLLNAWVQFFQIASVCLH